MVRFGTTKNKVSTMLDTKPKAVKKSQSSLACPILSGQATCRLLYYWWLRTEKMLSMLSHCNWHGIIHNQNGQGKLIWINMCRQCLCVSFPSDLPDQAEQQQRANCHLDSPLMGSLGLCRCRGVGLWDSVLVFLCIHEKPWRLILSSE